MKKIAGIVLRAAFLAAVILLLFRPETYGFDEEMFDDISPASLWNTLKELDPSYAIPWFAFGAFIKLCGITCGVFRWRLLLRAQGIKLPLWYLAKAWFMGRAVGLFLPGTMGLDGYRIVESSVQTGEVIKCTTVVVIEKLIGFIALALLVFLTLPLGLYLFEMNLAMLGVVLLILIGFIGTCFLLLLNPRVVQIIVAAFPVPGFLRQRVNDLGQAVTAYGHHRFALMGAVVLGLGVHAGTCLMYVGTAMAVSGGQWSVTDVLFASPFVIVGSVLAPTISGVGVREGVFAVVLGAKYGAAESVIAGHLGLWTGEIVPFFLSVPLLLLAGRPSKEKFVEEMKAVREAQAKNDLTTLLPHDEILLYRRRMFNAAGAGLVGGAIAGAVWGWAEGIWTMTAFEGLTEAFVLFWAPMTYAVVMGGMGVGIAAALLFFYLLFNKYPSGSFTAALGAAGAFIPVALVVGMFRYRRDVLGEHALGASDLALVGGGAVGGALVLATLVYIVSRVAKLDGARGLAAGILAALVLIVAGFGATVFAAPTVEKTPVVLSEAGDNAPNVVFVVCDTLRADFLDVYNADARPETPQLTAFSGDGIVFEKAFANSSWTKASFGTIFSGMYPETHTATGKASALPLEITTMAEALEAAGYYTQGYANNPNISKVFQYDQGFAQYIDLPKDLYFGAEVSCEKVVIYDVLRRVVQQVNKRLGGRIRITDFYQPANRVTDRGLEWLDGEDRPEDNPFFLFLHYMDPHDPFRDPERPGKGYARAQMGDPDPEKYLEAFLRSYSYEVEFMDTEFGRLIEGLKERELYEDTLIVFTSDHGEEFHEHGGWWHGLSLYEEQIAIPLILKLPGNAQAGTRNADIARHVDIAPTLTQWAGAAPGDAWQGKALVDGSGAALNVGQTQSYAHLDFEGIVLHALRGVNSKLIEANEGNKRNYAPVEFYNLEVDPGEQNNLAGDAAEAENLSTFQQTLKDMREAVLENQAEPALPAAGMDESLQEELEALGYIE